MKWTEFISKNAPFRGAILDLFFTGEDPIPESYFRAKLSDVQIVDGRPRFETSQVTKFNAETQKWVEPSEGERVSLEGFGRFWEEPIIVLDPSSLSKGQFIFVHSLGNGLIYTIPETATHEPSAFFPKVARKAAA